MDKESKHQLEQHVSDVLDLFTAVYTAAVNTVQTRQRYLGNISDAPVST